MRRIPILLSLCLFAALLFSASAHASGGTVTGWGYNGYGEVGTGEATKTITCECITTPVAIPGLSGVSQTAGGYYFSLFLSTDGTVKSVGRNDLGQLGNGAVGESPVPTVIPGLSNVVAIAAGGENGFALVSNGTVMAWGDNEVGQLGVGAFSGPEECFYGDSCSMHPVVVPGLSNVVAVSAVGNVALALLADGTVMGWGENTDGQLGDGVGNTEAGCKCIDHPVAIPGVANAIAISAGESWGMALLADRSVTAWGENYYGQLGTGHASNLTTGCHCMPPTKTFSGVRSISAGGSSGAAVMLDGSVKTWGFNDHGQLGNGTHVTTGCECDPIPMTIPEFADAQAVSADYNDTTALLADGTVKGSGFNELGELGDETTKERLSPEVTKVSGASAIDARYYGGSAIVGPSQTLSVVLAGAGTGTVQGGDGEITCPTVCTAKYPQGRVTFLTATSSAGGFAGFSGPCTGTATCQAKMEADQTVTATFGVPKGTEITKAKITGKKTKKASFTFTAPGAVTGYQCLLAKLKPKRHKARASKKRKKPKFASCKRPRTYKDLKPGSYTFEVRALDILGADAAPAKRVFKVKAPAKPKRH